MSVANVCRSDDTAMYHMNSAEDRGRERGTEGSRRVVCCCTPTSRGFAHSYVTVGNLGIFEVS